MAVREGNAGGRICPETGLAVPECSCKRCLETMLREFSPDLLTGESPSPARSRAGAPPRASAARPPDGPLDGAGSAE